MSDLLDPITTADAPPIRVTDWPRVWGLEPAELHEKFWSYRGVQVVPQGRSLPLEPHAELYLLAPTHSFVLFRLLPLVDLLSWLRLRVLFVKLPTGREEGYRELALTDDDSHFLGYQRIYEKPGRGAVRVALTPDREIATAWQQATTLYGAWERLLRETSSYDSETTVADGKIYDASEPPDVVQFVHDLAALWQRPDKCLRGVSRRGPDVWVDASAEIESGARVVGPVWVGAGRKIESGESFVGPSILWDDPRVQPGTGEASVHSARQRWTQKLLTGGTSVAGPRRSSRSLDDSDERVRPDQPRTYRGKRAFDIVVSLIVLTLCLPLLPLVMLAIWLDDRRPFFFTHRRETFGGKEFPCVKFRSMRRDAEEIKARLKAENQIDGPQFFMENDPRLIRIGAFLRKTNIDELPQFINVLLGDMSVVGPRPSPYDENQFCPAWREARLSVRPGVTGLWQVRRTRKAGLDFQEWIQYDIEYVEKMSLWLDLWIVAKTFQIVVASVFRAVFRRRTREDTGS